MKTYDLGKFGVPTYAPTKSIPGNPHTGTSAYTSSPKRNTGHASTYGINPDIIAQPKSGWELDDDTAGFMTDVFNTLNSPLEDKGYGGGGSGGGGSGGGGGGSYQGSPGTGYDTSWDFGRLPKFQPKGLL
jgi:hypothetical protein